MSEKKVTGKQIATDFIVLARDVGIYLATLGKIVYAKLKTAFDSPDDKSKREAAPNANG